MGLVDYPVSDSEEDAHATLPPAKKRRINNAQDENVDTDLPPLPHSFRDLYTSTVRQSTTDDPSLHAGRKRIIPHIAGNWAAHVYLEWHPSPTESKVLSDLVATIRSHHSDSASIHTLLTDSLEVPLPLHISLSAPLVLRTETKDAFLESMTAALKAASNRIASLSVSPTNLSWFSNAERTRAFLVLRLGKPEEDEGGLNALLNASNDVAARFDCARLYAGERGPKKGISQTKKDETTNLELDATGAFHISLAWSLNADEVLSDSLLKDSRMSTTMEGTRALRIGFSEVKVRLGKDVTSVPFGRTRQGAGGISS